MRIVAYSYNAEFKCVHHATEDWQIEYLKRADPLEEPNFDSNGLPMDLIDSEGNPVHPIHDHDDEATHAEDECGDCLWEAISARKEGDGAN